MEELQTANRQDPVTGDDAFDLALREPELRLMLAVLEDAIVQFQKGLDSPSPVRRRRFREVGTWVESRDFDSPFSFENVCEALRLDPDYIRDGLTAAKVRTLVAKGGIPHRRVRRSIGDDHRPKRNPAQ